MYQVVGGVVLLMFVAIDMPVVAEPNLGNAHAVSGTTVYADHELSNLFYFLPRPFELAFDAKQEPIFRYDIFRYIGRRELGDSDAFRARGVLTFEVRQQGGVVLHRQLVAAVKKKFGQNVVLKPAPVLNFESRLVYKTVEPQGYPPSEETSIDGGVSKEVTENNTPKVTSGWTNRRFTIGLKSLSAELFWTAFERDNLLLSLAYAWKIPGVILDETETEPWQKRIHELSGTLALSLSRTKWPSKFKKSDIGQNMKIGHPIMTVLCYDFINEMKQGLYSVMVEVKYKTERDQDYSEKVWFRDGEDSYEQDIRFKLPKDLQGGYQYRIHRKYADGSPDESTEWHHHTGQQLDVSYYDD